jgi:hypothetical protein
MVRLAPDDASGNTCCTTEPEAAEDLAVWRERAAEREGLSVGAGVGCAGFTGSATTGFCLSSGAADEEALSAEALLEEALLEEALLVDVAASGEPGWESE